MRRSVDEIGATSISFRPKVFSDPASVSPFLLNANSVGQKQDQRYVSDMKKIKSKLVTFITDNVRLVDKNLVGRIG